MQYTFVDDLSSRSLRRELRDFCILISSLRWVTFRISTTYLGKAGLITKVEKPADAILARLKVIVLDKPEPGKYQVSINVSEIWLQAHTLCTFLSPSRQWPCSAQLYRIEKRMNGANRR